MAKGPLTDAERAEILKLQGQGMSRNDIARQLGRSGASVSKVVADAQRDFVRGPGVIAATEANRVDAKARRARLQLGLIEDAERLREQLWQPAKAFSFGGKENTYNETTLAEPTFPDKRNIVQAVSTAVTAIIRIDEHDKVDEGTSGLDAFIAHLAGNA